MPVGNSEPFIIGMKMILLWSSSSMLKAASELLELQYRSDISSLSEVVTPTYSFTIVKQCILEFFLDVCCLRLLISV